MELPKKITLAEVGLRDGLQNECIRVDTDKKMELLRDIMDAGFHVIEVGSFVRPDKVPQMADTGELFRRVAPTVSSELDLRALIPNHRGLENAIASGCKSVKIGVSASRAHNLRNYNRTPEESIAAFESIFADAADHGISVIGTVQMAFGSPWEGDIHTEEILSIVSVYDRYHVERVGLGDTASMANPGSVYRLCSELRDHFPNIHFKAHFHNARGLGLSNVLAAMSAGLTEFDGAFAGLGGCPFVPNAAGNISTEDLLNMCDELGIETGINMEKVMSIGHKIEQIVGHEGNSFLLRAGTSRELIDRISNAGK